MKTTIFAALFCAFAFTAQAEDYTLYVVSSAAQTTYPLSNLQKITFSDGNVIIQTKSGETGQVPISTIQRMYFDSTPTSIAEAKADSGLAWDGKTLRMIGASGTLEVYQTSGALVSKGVVTDGESINLSQLPKGVYIVKAGGQSFKIMKK